MLYLVLDPGLLSAGNRVTLLEDGREAYPAMLEAIAGARHSVLLEMYAFAGDGTGRRFVRALCDKAREGVPVRVIYDGAGSRETPTAIFHSMRAAGVFVTPFRPLGWYTWRKRDHRKLLAVDGRVGFVGGINISDEFVPEGGNWRDAQVRIEGPEVADLVTLFAEVWREEEDDPLFPKGPPPATAPFDDGVQVAVMGSGRSVERRKIGRHHLHAIRQARRRIWIANAYFVPSVRVLRALRRAAHRGVDVRILIPVKTDAWPVYHATRALFAGLLKAGVRIFEYRERVLHAKTILVDGVWSSVGSYNFDHLSLFRNYELTALILGPAFGARMEAAFEEDLRHAAEIRRSDWRKRPFIRKLREQFFYQFRSLL